MVAIEGRVWHQHRLQPHGRPASGGDVRAGTRLPIYRPQENWFLALDDQVVDTASDDLLVLLGYRAIGLGLVNGASPR